MAGSVSHHDPLVLEMTVNFMTDCERNIAAIRLLDFGDYVHRHKFQHRKAKSTKYAIESGERQLTNAVKRCLTEQLEWLPTR